MKGGTPEHFGNVPNKDRIFLEHFAFFRSFRSRTDRPARPQRAPPLPPPQAAVERRYGPSSTARAGQRSVGSEPMEQGLNQSLSYLSILSGLSQP